MGKPLIMTRGYKSTVLTCDGQDSKFSFLCPDQDSTGALERDSRFLTIRTRS